MRPLSLAPPQPARAPPGAAPGPRSRLRQTPVLIVATLVINLLSMALPIVILQVYDRVIPNNALATLLILVCGLGVAILIDALLRSARAAVAGWLAASHEHALGCTMVEALLGADLRTLEAQSPGVQLDRLGSVDAVRDFHASEGPLILVDLPFVVLFLALMYLIGGSIVVAPIVIAAVFGIVCLHLGGRLRFALTERSAWDDRRINFAIEILNGIHTIKAHAMENLMARRYERLMESTAGATRRIAFQSATAQNVGALFSQLSLAGVAAYGSVLVLQGNLTIGALGACTLLAGRTIQPLLRALGVWTQLQRLAVAKVRIGEVLALPRETTATATMPTIRGGIVLSNVMVRYGDAKPVLDGVSLEIAPGEVIAVSGGNGSGKSTLLGVIAGLIAPNGGAVSIDGVDLKTVDPGSVRRQIAFVPQNGALFQGTIMENLTLFKGDAAIDDAVAAARGLALDEAIARLPEGFATRVGHGVTETLPGGVIQRIAVARAVVGERPIFLFDEANTRLDQRSDEHLRTYLQGLKGRCTMVLVTYRPSLMRLADRRFHLDQGRLIEQATAATEQPMPVVRSA